MKTQTKFDIAFLGHYTKDTIVVANKEKTVDGGAVIYGANVAARMGLRTAVITRMATQDFRVLEELHRLGVQTFARETSESTMLKLVYPSGNLDERVIYVTGFAEPFSMEELSNVQASTFHVAASVRGEVPTQVVQSLKERADRVSLDVQGFVRINSHGKLVSDDWRDKEEVLNCVDVVKADLVEATIITGAREKQKAAKALAALGPSEVVLTNNEGVLVHANGNFYEAPFRPTELKGRSGRGDTCIAAYLTKRATAPPAEATIWAAALTSLKLENEGPFRREIREVRELIKSKYQA
jgi:sugar/nucleoside kinase (ribokinase family)